MRVSVLEQSIVGDEVSLGRSIISGLCNAVSGMIYGLGRLGSVRKAFGKGLVSGASRSGIEYLYETLGKPKKKNRRKSVKGRARRVAAFMPSALYGIRDPRRNCTPQKSRKEVPGTGTAFYGVGKGLESLWGSVKGNQDNRNKNSRYSRDGYQSNGRSNNLLGRDRSTRKTINLTEWRRSINKRDIHNEMKLFLGNNYVKVDAGKWRSIDRNRQFRVKPDDYLSKHGIGQPTVPNIPHRHFEFLLPRSNGNGFDVIKNVHVPLNN